jgi:hypothetical protein
MLHAAKSNGETFELFKGVQTTYFNYSQKQSHVFEANYKTVLILTILIDYQRSITEQMPDHSIVESINKKGDKTDSSNYLEI